MQRWEEATDADRPEAAVAALLLEKERAGLRQVEPRGRRRCNYAHAPLIPCGLHQCISNFPYKLVNFLYTIFAQQGGIKMASLAVAYRQGATEGITARGEPTGWGLASSSMAEPELRRGWPRVVHPFSCCPASLVWQHVVCIV